MGFRQDLAYWKLGRRMTKKERHCFLKAKLTEDEAMIEARRLRKKGDNTAAYRCDDCGEWHVGRRKKAA